jgi:hypothetical protein
MNVIRNNNDIVSLLIFYFIPQLSILLFACIQACVLESLRVLYDIKNRKAERERERERRKKKEKGGKTRETKQKK